MKQKQTQLQCGIGFYVRNCRLEMNCTIYRARQINFKSISLLTDWKRRTSPLRSFKLMPTVEITKLNVDSGGRTPEIFIFNNTALPAEKRQSHKSGVAWEFFLFYHFSIKFPSKAYIAPIAALIIHLSRLSYQLSDLSQKQLLCMCCLKCSRRSKSQVHSFFVILK